ncbi:Protein LURP-one-related 6 [Carex littledalei]|uniref:Protein LURP-one-related 6 n=1 Tax=Carex littledalei TaxID=544730 RepID=A0A833RR71_9POAL|nr:Protein LURP-one-related 6 [Carex littledalei]
MRRSTDVVPIVSKLYCSSSPALLTIRKRPVVVNGGGFVVTDSSYKVVFVVDGCGKLGAKGELMVKDGEGESILYIHKKGGIVQALTARSKWSGYSVDYQGQNRLVFSLTDPKSCCASNSAIRISIEPKGQSNYSWDFYINGSFVDKAFTIMDRNNRIIAQVDVQEFIGSKDLYQVWVQSGYDQAFVIGIIAVLDNIFGESTSC